jgi:hypothetical protein
MDEDDRSELTRSEQWLRAALHPAVHRERYWPAYAGLGIAAGLQIALPATFTAGPSWVLPSAELMVLGALVAGRYAHPRRREPKVMMALRYLTLGAIGLTSLANLASLDRLVDELLHGLSTDGRTLILAALGIWVTNVIVFALWFWELDGGGPVRRRADPQAPRDFLFPQMSLPDDGHAEAWQPDFVDYAYVAYTNATAFSPTDTMPLGRWAKTLMLIQSAAALLTVALIAAHAVNILR